MALPSLATWTGQQAGTVGSDWTSPWTKDKRHDVMPALLPCPRRLQFNPPPTPAISAASCGFEKDGQRRDLDQPDSTAFHSTASGTRTSWVREGNGTVEWHNLGVDRYRPAPVVPSKRPRLDSCCIQPAHERCSEDSHSLSGEELEHGGDQRAVEGAMRTVCEICRRTADLAPQIASGLEKLFEELSLIIHDPHTKSTEAQISAPPETVSPPEGLLESLNWSLRKLGESLYLARKAISASHSQALKQSAMSDAEFPSPSCYPLPRMELEEPHPIHRSLLPNDGGARRQALPPLVLDGNKKEPSSNSSEGGPPLPSPYSASSLTSQQQQQQQQGPIPVIGQAAANHNLNHPMVPLPTALKLSTGLLPNFLPPVAPFILGPSCSSASATGASSAHTAQVEVLRHQIRTKCDENQTLRTESTNLIKALMRLENDYVALADDFGLRKAEVAGLVGERQRLQDSLDAAEAKIEALLAAGSESSRQAATNGDQYLQILNKAAELQMKGAAEMRQWKADREAWRSEKGNLLEEIKGLEMKNCALAASNRDGHGGSHQDSLRNTTTDNRPSANSSGTIELSDSQAAAAASSSSESDEAALRVLAEIPSLESTRKLYAEVQTLRRRAEGADKKVARYAEAARAIELVSDQLSDVGLRFKEIDQEQE